MTSYGNGYHPDLGPGTWDLGPGTWDLGPGPWALLTGKQIFVLTTAEKLALKHKRISRVSKKIQSS